MRVPIWSEYDANIGRISPVAAGYNRSYLKREHRPLPVRINDTMPMSVTSSARISLPLAALSAVIAMLLAGTLALWGYYGTAVFFEMLRAGWAACF